MAICAGCGCTCVVDGTTITGAGTLADPFVAGGGACAQKNVYTVATLSTPEPFRSCADFIGNGVNDQVAIQAAINTLGQFPSGTVFLLPGTFNTSATITLKFGTSLIGTRGSSTINYSGTGYAVSSGGSGQVTVQDLTINGNAGGSVDFGFGTYQGVVFNCILKATGVTRSTLSLQGTDIRIINNSILADSDANGFAVTVLSSSPSNHIISENNIYGPGGIQLDGVQGGVVSNNVIAGSFNGPSSGLYLTGSVKQFLITGNVIRDFGRQGVRVFGASDSIISNNVIFNVGRQTNNTYDGILIEGSSSLLTVQGNQIRRGTGNAPRYGINVSGAGCIDNMATNNDLLNSGVTASFNDTGVRTITAAGNRL